MTHVRNTKRGARATFRRLHVRSRVPPLSAFAFVLVLLLTQLVEAQTLQTVDQFGTPRDDAATGLAVSRNAVYVVGQTGGRFAPHRRLGGADAFLAKFTLDGTMRWVRQFGTRQDDGATAV